MTTSQMNGVVKIRRSTRTPSISTKLSGRAPTVGVRVYTPQVQLGRKFHALPPGRYELDIDLTGLSEPLLPRGPIPGFTVEIGGTAPRLKVYKLIRVGRMRQIVHRKYQRLRKSPVPLFMFKRILFDLF